MCRLKDQPQLYWKLQFRLTQIYLIYMSSRATLLNLETITQKDLRE